MLMMLAAWFVKWPQSLGQFVLQTSGAWGAVRPKPCAADAHDARLLVRQMAPITRAVRFANVRGFGAVRPKPYAADAHDARLLVRQMAPITRAVRFANVRGFGGRAAKTIRS